MSESDAVPAGPDLALGVASGDLPEGAMLAGHMGGEAVLLARTGGRLHAVGALCPHYHAPLVDGLLVGDTVRCAWHHARFCLKTGAAIGPPAFDALPRWRVHERDGRVYVGEREPPPAPPRRPHGKTPPGRVVLVGGGAGGFAAAERLRREGFDGDLTMVSADPDPPYDRPNLSKHYLAGEAPAEWMPLRDVSFYDQAGIDLRTGTEAAAIEIADRALVLTTGERLAWDALILATGAAAVRPATPGFDNPRVHVLRSLRDGEALIAAAAGARRAVVIGASFIGLETAAALIQRGLEVHVVAPETTPLARILGEDLGRFVRALHERKGVVFHLGREASGFADGALTLDDGSVLPADLVVLGVGVKPRTRLAAEAGLRVDDGVVVGPRLETGAPGVFAVGDIARYPDRRTGALIRVEHWVAAQRQGQHVAQVLLGQADLFTQAPFFWSAHYDTVIDYVGHAQAFDAALVDGDIAAHDAVVRFTANGRLLAAATLDRDIQSLTFELAFESGAGA
jgi:NADPH-dependent 2,4-dienoyl-CoA reductase/sulfur reductase-like enzyme/nitrite reductase/ring-hydroxylating ferredoxin subunit